MSEPQCKNTIVEIKDLTYRRPSKVIFDGVNISVPQGKITAVMGPSGTGKTTLLQLIGGMIRPEAGEVYVHDQNVHKLSRKHLFKLRRLMGMLFQHGALFTDLSVFDNVVFPLREHTSLPEDMLRDLVLMKLEAVGLRGTEHLFPNELSGGMSRRVALARAIALDPELMMYDEPFTGQDPIAKAVLLKLIAELNRFLGLTAIVVSHDVHETAEIADYICVLSGGKVIGFGEPDEIMGSDDPAIHQFMHGDVDGVVPFRYPASGPYTEDLDLC